jgi:plastocyanin
MKINKSILFQKVAALVVTGSLAMFAPISQGATVTVTCVGDSFSPPSVTINVGDTVVWSGLANAHNVTGANTGDLNQFCGSSLSSFATESSCSRTFTTAGTFPYECTIHASCCGMTGSITVVAAAPTPTVSITSPAGGAAFTAPASVPITANASVSSGTVTNVAFFASTNNITNSLGSVRVSPFTITAANLAVGNYALTAVATAAGVSATSAVVNIAVHPPAPTVSITNPVGGAVFSAPAILHLGSTAAVSIGTVTNVAFVATSATTTNSLGSAHASPFNTSSSSLGAGNYSLTAVATAAGISATSAVVNISVVTPLALSNSVPVVAAGQFSFNYSANVGLTYVVQRTSDLSTWVNVVTNAASVNPSHFTESAVVSGARYYRVLLQPNP